MILRPNVQYLELLEVKVTRFEDLRDVLTFLSIYRGVRALTLLYEPDDFHHELPRELAYYPGLLKLSISTQADEFYHIFHHLPKFPNLESLKCTVMVKDYQSEEAAMHQVVVSSRNFRTRGNWFKHFSIVSLYSIYDNSCSRAGAALFMRDLLQLLTGLEHLHIASGSHVHADLTTLYSLTETCKGLVSLHLVSQPSYRPAKYFEEARTRLSPPFYLPPMFARGTLIPCAPASLPSLYQVFQFTWKAKNLRYLSLVFDADVMVEHWALEAPAMRILHVGTSPIEPLVKEAVATKMKMCFPNLCLILHGYHDCVGLKEKEQARTWQWVNEKVCEGHPIEEEDWDLAQALDLELRHHEVSPMSIPGK
jgi:hypothetical protein